MNYEVQVKPYIVWNKSLKEFILRWRILLIEGTGETTQTLVLAAPDNKPLLFSKKGEAENAAESYKKARAKFDAA